MRHFAWNDFVSAAQLLMLSVIYLIKDAMVAVIAASVTRGGAIPTKGASMPKPMKTGKHKLNSAHVHGALIIAGFLGLVTGSWLIFALAAGALVFTSIQDGSIRI